MRSNKWIFIAGAVIVFILCIYCQTARSADDLLTVEGQKIGMEEYMMIMERNKSYVYNYFTGVYNIQPGELKWNKRYEGDVPISMLIQKTNEKLIENNLIMWNAETSFQEIKQLYETEKLRRQVEAEYGNVVYGPLDLDLYEYFDYYLEEKKAQLSEAVYLEKNITEEQLKEYYEREKDVLFVKNKEAKAVRIYSDNKEDMVCFLNYAQQSPGNRDGFITYAKENGLKTEEIELTEGTQHHDNSVYPNLRNAVLYGKEGQVTEITKNGNTWDTALVVEVRETSFYSYEEVKAAVENEYMRLLFNEQMELWKEDSKITQGKGLRESIQKVLLEEGFNE